MCLVGACASRLLRAEGTLRCVRGKAIGTGHQCDHRIRVPCQVELHCRSTASRPLLTVLLLDILPVLVCTVHLVPTFQAIRQAVMAHHRTRTSAATATLLGHRIIRAVPETIGTKHIDQRSEKGRVSLQTIRHPARADRAPPPFRQASPSRSPEP